MHLFHFDARLRPGRPGQQRQMLGAAVSRLVGAGRGEARRCGDQITRIAFDIIGAAPFPLLDPVMGRVSFDLYPN